MGVIVHKIGGLLAASAIAVLALLSPAAFAQGNQITLSAPELFNFADTAIERDDLDTAEAVYRALLQDTDLEVRTEARFRLALLLANGRKQPAAAAVELRHILDDKPNAARVRIELANVLAQMGDADGASRELRYAQAGGLPPDVARYVEFYSEALRSRRSFGASIEFALAPDSNINRATSSETLGTILGEFTLSEDARQSSGLGISSKQQAYWRPRLSDNLALLARISASENLYRQDEFNDVSATLQIGPEIQIGNQSLAVAGIYGERWFGGDQLSRSTGLTINYATPVSPVTQMRLDTSLIDSDDQRNDAQDAKVYSFSAALEHAFSPTEGGVIQLAFSRADASDPGYASTSGMIGAVGFKEFGRTSLVVSMSYTHLEADERLLLFAKRRVDDRYSASIGATFRDLSYWDFAPFVRSTYEHSASTVGLYAYDRTSAEFGLARAF